MKRRMWPSNGLPAMMNLKGVVFSTLPWNYPTGFFVSQLLGWLLVVIGEFANFHAPHDVFVPSSHPAA